MTACEQLQPRGAACENRQGIGQPRKGRFGYFTDGNGIVRRCACLRHTPNLTNHTGHAMT